VKDFFMRTYLVPETLYDAHESVFFQLILNTVHDVSNFGVPANPVVDNAIKNGFRQKANMDNLGILFTNPGIRGLWTNQWGGMVVSYIDSKHYIRILLSLNPIDVLRFINTLEKMKLSPTDFLPQKFL
jgi:hypothetical protein